MIEAHVAVHGDPVASSLPRSVHSINEASFTVGRLCPITIQCRRNMASTSDIGCAIQVEPRRCSPDAGNPGVVGRYVDVRVELHAAFRTLIRYRASRFDTSIGVPPSSRQASPRDRSTSWHRHLRHSAPDGADWMRSDDRAPVLPAPALFCKRRSHIPRHSDHHIGSIEQRAFGFEELARIVGLAPILELALELPKQLVHACNVGVRAGNEPIVFGHNLLQYIYSGSRVSPANRTPPFPRKPTRAKPISQTGTYLAKHGSDVMRTGRCNTCVHPAGGLDRYPQRVTHHSLWWTPKLPDIKNTFAS